MSAQELQVRIRRISKRRRWFQLLRQLAVVWLVAAVVGAVGWFAFPSALGSDHVLAFLFLAVSTGVAIILSLRIGRRSGLVHDTVIAIEKSFPSLNERLLTASEQTPQHETGDLTYLQKQLIGEVIAHSDRHGWYETVPGPAMRRAVLSHSVALVLWLGVAGLLFGRPSIQQRPLAPISDNQTVLQKAYDITVDPGNTSIERGTSLLVLARFVGTVPSEVNLVIENTDEANQSIGLTKSLADPVFGGRVDKVMSPLNYRIKYDRQSTEEFHVHVFDFPEVERVDASVTFPAYTELPETVVEDTRQITLVEGSTLTLECLTNKPIALAQLVAEDQTTLELQPDADRVARLRGSFAPQKSTHYRIELVDDEGRQNKTPEEFTVTVVPNRPPELTLTFPARDLRVSPLEEMSLEATAWDDFGLKRFGLIYTSGDNEPATIVLGENAPAKTQQQLKHQLSLEVLNAKPDQLVSYYFFAEDAAPDGQPRCIFSDMYFAEVRHFEEIFRQGMQPPSSSSKKEPSGKGETAQKLDELTQLQKQILNATWKLIRREATTSASPSKAFDKDVRLIQKSQAAALEKVQELSEKLRDTQSKAFVTEVSSHMTRAVKSLTQAATDRSVEPLHAGLAAERAAYQALLKLRAREYEVTRRQSAGKSAGKSSGRSQQQLQQLELSNKENRYETERKASSDRNASTANREQLQVLNRLKELARRQGDLNQKLKELENELRAAKTDKEREELQRQLKRLRDEQQHLLRDVDELKERMDRAENQRHMADSRKQLDGTRSRVLQSSEALKKGQVSKAIAAGTRAQRELEQLRDKVRQQSASQFADAMRDLRSQARELAENEDAVAQKLDQIGQDAQRSLRAPRERQDAADELQTQRDRLKNVLDEARQITKRAETSEPLLSRQLYETIRKTRELKPDESLDVTSRFLQEGLVDQARATERNARRGIATVQKGIEKAAESVLGNELEALKLAQSELRDLSKQLADELAQANPKSSRENNIRQTARNEAQNANNRSGKNASNRASSKNQNPNQNAKSSQQPGSQQSQPNGREESRSANRTNSQEPGARRPIGSLLRKGEFTGGPGGPLTGENFQQWSDRMRNVEEMLGDPRLQSEVAKIRDRARSARVEFKRHSKQPQWSLVRTQIFQPMQELQTRLADEIARHNTGQNRLPIDRDPVPERFSELVRRYYESLGSGK